jgi:hypothetical protein
MGLYFIHRLLRGLKNGITAIIRWIARAIPAGRLKRARHRGKHMNPEQAREKIREIHEEG